MRRRNLWCIVLLSTTLLLGGCGGTIPSEESGTTSSKEETKNIAGVEKENESPVIQQAPLITEPKNDKVLVKEEEYDGDENLTIVTNYYYDDQGNLVKEETSNFNAGNAIYGLPDWTSERIEYEYDSRGHKIKQTNYDIYGNIGNWEEFERNAQGETIKRTTFNSDGNIAYWIEYTRDNQGNAIKSMDNEGWTTERKYNEQGKKTEIISYDKAGNIEHWQEYEYNEQGDLVKEAICSSKGNIYLSEYEYNEQGNLVKLTEDSTSEVIVSEYNEYSGEDKVAVQRVQYSDSDVIDREIYYEYDDMGNLQSKVTYDLWSYDGNAVLVSNKHMVNRVEYTYE